MAVGEVQRKFLIELKDKMKQKFKYLKQENEKLSEVSWFDDFDDELPMVAAFLMNFGDYLNHSDPLVLLIRLIIISIGTKQDVLAAKLRLH